MGLMKYYEHCESFRRAEGSDPMIRLDSMSQRPLLVKAQSKKYGGWNYSKEFNWQLS
jgi:hypothetical protein